MQGRVQSRATTSLKGTFRDNQIHCSLTVFLPVLISQDLDRLSVLCRQVSPLGDLLLDARNNGVLPAAAGGERQKSG